MFGVLNSSQDTLYVCTDPRDVQRLDSILRTRRWFSERPKIRKVCQRDVLNLGLKSDSDISLFRGSLPSTIISSQVGETLNLSIT